MLLCQAAEAGDVVLSLEIEFAGVLFVDVPEGVDADGVHAQCLAHLDAVFPIFGGNARVVHFGGFHHERLPVEQEGLVAYGKVVRLSLGGGAGRGQQSARQETGK